MLMALWLVLSVRWHLLHFLKAKRWRGFGLVLLLCSVFLWASNMQAAPSEPPDLMLIENKLCHEIETSEGLPMRQVAVNDKISGSDLGICQTNTSTLKALGYLSYYDANGKWIKATRDDVAKVFTERGSREITREALARIIGRIAVKGWTMNVYNIGSLYCAYSLPPNRHGPCHSRAMKLVNAVREAKRERRVTRNERAVDALPVR